MGSNSSTMTQDGSQVQWNRKPFDEGQSRLAFKGEWVKGPERGLSCVVKIYKNKNLAYRYNINKELECYQLAQKYSNSFCQKSKYTYKINFITPVVLRVSGVSFAALFQKNFKSGDNIIVEPYLYGYYQKFNSNTGWVGNSAEICQAFSHYTYSESQQQLLICDLQGIQKNGEFILTDPAVHSRLKGEYGITDLGMEGIKAFFSQHVCGDICKWYKLKNPNLGRSSLRRMKETSYIITS
jgi:hypothetical protein